MSHKASNWAWEWVSQLSGKGSLILLKLADLADDEGLCHPSYNYIARMAGCDRRTVIRAIRDMEQRGLISVVERDRKRANGSNTSNVYRLHLKTLPSDKKSPPLVTKSHQLVTSDVTPPSDIAMSPLYDPSLRTVSDKEHMSEHECPDVRCVENSDSDGSRPAVTDRPGAAVQSASGKLWGDSIDLEIANEILAGVQRVTENTTKQPNMAAWANEIRLMREKDRRKAEHIRILFQWSNNHAFWFKNILSPAKLREKWPQLVADRKQALGGHHAASNRTTQQDGFNKQLTDPEYARANF